jgi:hypothetical protein
LETLFHTLEDSVTFSVVTLFRSGVSTPSQFGRLILRQPRTHTTAILTTSREDWYSCVTENNRHFYILVYDAVWFESSRTTLKTNALYSCEHADICVPLYPTPYRRRTVSLPTSLCETRILQHFFHTSKL